MSRSNASFACSLLALALSAFALFKSLSFRGAEPPRHDLIHSMATMQRHLEKTYFAAKSGHWDLSAWYLHELEESAEDLIEAGVAGYGQNLSALAGEMLRPALKEAERSAKARDFERFLTSYQTLVASCNACHAASEHPFLKLVVPEEPTYKNQDFRP